MIEQHQPETEQPSLSGAAQNDAASLAAVGAKLREARERGGMSIGDVANRLKFAPRQIEALEEGDLSQLPERAFIRGFVRSYARLVQLDEGPLLAALPGAPAPAARPGAEPRAVQQTPVSAYAAQHSSSLLWVGAAVIVAVLIAIINWPSGSRPPESRSGVNAASAPAAIPAVSGVPAASAPVSVTAPVAGTPAEQRAAVAPPPPAAVKKPHKPLEAAKPQAASAVPATRRRHVQPASAVPPAPATGESGAQAGSAVPATEKPRTQGVLRLMFDEDSWVEVTDEAGAVLLSQLCQAGTEQRVTSALPLSVVIGNAKGVRVYYRGRQIDTAPHMHGDRARLKLR